MLGDTEKVNSGAVGAAGSAGGLAIHGHGPKKALASRLASGAARPARHQRPPVEACRPARPTAPPRPARALVRARG